MIDTFIYNQDFKRELRGNAHPFGEVSFLESLAAPGMTALDVGANKGLTTVAMAKKVAPDGLVYAFEAVPEYYRALQANLSRNDIHNVKAYPCALGDRIGRVDYYKVGGRKRHCNTGPCSEDLGGSHHPGRLRGEGRSGPG